MEGRGKRVVACASRRRKVPQRCGPHRGRGRRGLLGRGETVDACWLRQEISNRIIVHRVVGGSGAGGKRRRMTAESDAACETATGPACDLFRRGSHRAGFR